MSNNKSFEKVCEDKSSLDFAPPPPVSPRSVPTAASSSPPPPVSPRGQPSRPAPGPPRSASSSRSFASVETVDDVQQYFRVSKKKNFFFCLLKYGQGLGASDESLELLQAEQVDGSALRLFSNDELRDNFKLSLGVLKKHSGEQSGDALRKSANAASSEREKEEAERRRAEAEREAEEARRQADRNASQLDQEHRRRLQAERELSEAKRLSQKKKKESLSFF